MTRKKSRGVVQFFMAHGISLGAMLVFAVAAGAFVYLYNGQANEKIAETNQASIRAINDADAKLKEIQDRKAAEEKARKEAGAKEAAEQAKTANGNTAETIDSTKCNSSNTRNDPASIDVMVNKKHCIQPLTFAPGDLITANGATLSAKAMPAFNQMYNAAAAAGQGFYVTSSYRSYTDQVSTYNYWVGVSGQAGADTYSARPGYSEHQTGLVFDVAASGCVLDCFGSTPQYQWLQQNAANYGFIQRYHAGDEPTTGYKAEEWHYRYVGVQVAKDMKAKGIRTLEQYWNMPGGDY